MRIAYATLQSISAYSQSKHYEVDKLARETHEDFDARTWRHRMHVDEAGKVYIPPMSLKKSIATAANHAGIKVPGRRGKTYDNFFTRGILVQQPVTLPYLYTDIQCERLFVSSDGKPGGSTRVWRHFPLIPEWKGTAEFFIVDEIINEDVFLQHLKIAGSAIGIGRFRPEKNGFYGRFKVLKVEWQDVPD